MNGPARDPLASIRYLRLDAASPRSISGFQVRPEVPLPVELDADPGELARSGIPWEAILSAMLKILAYDPEHRDAAYFREFVIAVRPDIDAELTQAAIAKSRTGAYDVAIEVFRALEGLYPRNPRHPVNLALVYEARAARERESGDEGLAEQSLQSAFEAYRRAIALDPRMEDARFAFAGFYLRRQNLDKARDELQAYLALEPSDPARTEEARRLVAEIDARTQADELFRSAYDFIRMGQEEKGIARVTGFLDANPGVWGGWFLLGWGHRRMRRYAEARQAFTRALELGERGPELLNELAICSMELGDLRSARAHLEEALRSDTENVKVLSNLAVLALREGRTEEALATFRVVLDLDPRDPVALDTVARLSGGEPATPPDPAGP